MRNVWIVFLVFGLVFFGSSNLEASDKSKKEEAAIASAQSWLKIVDAGNYGEAWEQAAPYLKNAVTKEKLEQQLTAVRKPMGKLIFRKLKSKKYATSLPGAPDGEYVVLQFNTSFENKKAAVETITPKLTKDGKWQVSGYYIK